MESILQQWHKEEENHEVPVSPPFPSPVSPLLLLQYFCRIVEDIINLFFICSDI